MRLLRGSALAFEDVGAGLGLQRGEVAVQELLRLVRLGGDRRALA